MREIQSLSRGLQILDLFVNTRRPHTVTELADILDVDKSSVSRLLGTLEKHGYVQQATDSRAYTLGKRMFTVGWQLTNRFSLKEIATPYLHQLVAHTGECAHIGVYSSGKVLVTEDIQPENALLRVVGQPGRSLHLHNTALGKGLLVCGDFPYPADYPTSTPQTLATQQALRDDLAVARKLGYVLDDEENEPGVRCIAAPIFDTTGVTVGAIGISGPTVRVTEDRIATLGETVRDAAQRLSCELGFGGRYIHEEAL